MAKANGSPLADSAPRRDTAILGGGIGGVATARALRKRAARRHRIVLVDRERDHVFAPSLPCLIVGQRTPRGISRPLAGLTRKGIDVRLGEVSHVDPDRRVVTVGGQKFSTIVWETVKRMCQAKASRISPCATSRHSGYSACLRGTDIQKSLPPLKASRACSISSSKLRS